MYKWINHNQKELYIQIASKLKIDDRGQKLDENEAYVTIKGHKEGFPDKISCRLINPSKTDIGKISKQILDRVNNTILEKKQSKPVEKHVFSYRMVR